MAGPTGNDRATDIVTGTFSATGQSSSHAFYGTFNVFLYGGTATIQLQRSYDGGVTWITCGIGGSGALASWDVTATNVISVVVSEPEIGMLYRLNCSAYTSAITYRMSTSSPAAMAWGLMS